MTVRQSRHVDVNAVVGGYLRDLAFAQSSQQKMFGYKRAAAAILALDMPLTDLVGPDGALPRISGIGPGSTRVIREILDTGESPTVEHAIERERPPRRHRAAAPASAAFSQPRRGPPRALGSRIRRPDARAVPRRSADALRMERRLSDGPGDCRRVPAAWLSICGGHRPFVRTEDRRRNVDGRRRPAAEGHRRRSTPGAAISSGCCRASKRTSTPRAGWISTTTRRPPSTWCWPRRIRGCERTRIRPPAC